MTSLVADTGGLLRALAVDKRGRASWPAHANALVQASHIIVPALVLVEVDYFLRRERAAMRKLVAEILDPKTTYELEQVSAPDLARALVIDAKFSTLELGLVDSMVAAIAERRRVTRILTIDRRDFTALRVGVRYDRRLEVIPRAGP